MFCTVRSFQIRLCQTYSILLSPPCREILVRTPRTRTKSPSRWHYPYNFSHLKVRPKLAKHLSHYNKALRRSRSIKSNKGPCTSNFIRDSPDSASELCTRSANAYMGTCGILCGTDGTSLIISNPNFFSLRKTLRMLLAIHERWRAGPDRPFNGGFALEVSANVWKDIS